MTPDIPDLTLGPAMQRLNEMQRRFVLAMAADPLGSQWEWAVAAGYSDKSGAAKVRAHHLLQSHDVQAAILEVAKRLLGTVGPMIATKTLLRIAADPDHKENLRAAEFIASRAGLIGGHL
jgi:phage terminase small subunit